jgi:hypothetical protein
MVESAFVIGHVQYEIITCSSLSFKNDWSHIGIFTFVFSKQEVQQQQTFWYPKANIIFCMEIVLLQVVLQFL